MGAENWPSKCTTVLGTLNLKETAVTGNGVPISSDSSHLWHTASGSRSLPPYHRVPSFSFPPSLPLLHSAVGVSNPTTSLPQSHSLPQSTGYLHEPMPSSLPNGRPAAPVTQGFPHSTAPLLTPTSTCEQPMGVAIPLGPPRILKSNEAPYLVPVYVRGERKEDQQDKQEMADACLQTSGVYAALSEGFAPVVDEPTADRLVMQVDLLHVHS